jgi:hypothetical protein
MNFSVGTIWEEILNANNIELERGFDETKVKDVDELSFVKVEISL